MRFSSSRLSGPLCPCSERPAGDTEAGSTGRHAWQGRAAARPEPGSGIWARHLIVQDKLQLPPVAICPASGGTVKDVLYLDLVDAEELMLYQVHCFMDQQGFLIWQGFCRLRCSGPIISSGQSREVEWHSPAKRYFCDYREPVWLPMVLSYATAIRLLQSPQTWLYRGTWEHILSPDHAGRRRMSADAFGNPREVPDIRS